MFGSPTPSYSEEEPEEGEEAEQDTPPSMVRTSISITKVGTFFFIWAP